MRWELAADLGEHGPRSRRARRVKNSPESPVSAPLLEAAPARPIVRDRVVPTRRREKARSSVSRPCPPRRGASGAARSRGAGGARRAPRAAPCPERGDRDPARADVAPSLPDAHAHLDQPAELARPRAAAAERRSSASGASSTGCVAARRVGAGRGDPPSRRPTDRADRRRSGRRGRARLDLAAGSCSAGAVNARRAARDPERILDRRVRRRERRDERPTTATASAASHGGRPSAPSTSARSVSSTSCATAPLTRPSRHEAGCRRQRASSARPA
jgi:hypothetical protein